MAKSKSPILKFVKGEKIRKTLRIGFLPENDCAPLIIAQEYGIFEKYGLEVTLQSQANWKRIHDRLLTRDLDAAIAPGMLPFIINLGLTSEKLDCVVGMVLNLQGSAITVSQELWNLGVRDAASMREQIWKDRKRRQYTFGVACPFSSHHVLLLQWLKAVSGPPWHNLKIDWVAPEQMFPLLKLGYIDGYCAGEPWNSVAVQAGVGVCLASSASLAPMHPEKVLMVRRDFVKSDADQHERLIAALIEACAFCDAAENRSAICELLAKPQFVNAPRECLEPDLLGPFSAKHSGLESLYGLNIFSRGRANEPTLAKAGWLTSGLFQFFRWNKRPASLNGVFRPDIFRRARARVLASETEPVSATTIKSDFVRKGICSVAGTRRV